MKRNQLSLQRALIVIAAGVVIAGIFSQPIEATDPPHDSNQAFSSECKDCHVGHTSLGNILTSAPTNALLCQKCHVLGGHAEDLEISDALKAIPSQRGLNHAYEVAAVNSTLGTQYPLNSQMLNRLMGTDPNKQIVCSTCHNQHISDSSMLTVPRIGNPIQLTSLGSSGSLTTAGAYTGTVGMWYLINIDLTGNETTAKFSYSKDNGSSFFPQQTAGTNVTLDSGVSVTFTVGTFVSGERWHFSAAYPFARISPDSGNNTSGTKFCRDCHRSWVMNHTAVETWDGADKSHPVGVNLTLNGRGYDRTIPLDGNGAIQDSGSADTIESNDLKLDSSNFIQCTTCHGIHDADSMTETEDER